jgi:LuxR family transcriptional regulator, maltose regulon positive regulatory protein
MTTVDSLPRQSRKPDRCSDEPSSLRAIPGVGQPAPTDDTGPARGFPPRVPPFAVRRERLEERLERHPDRQVILVRGPAGAGKTVLVAQWVRATDRRCAWLSIDATHNHPGRLLRDLVEVTGQVSPDTRDLLFGRPAVEDARDPVELWQVLRDTAQGVVGEVTLVVDDVHRLHDRTARQVLGHLVEHPPEDVRVVLVSRSKPRLGLERARLRGDLVEIVPAELRFRRAEVEALVSTWTGQNVVGPGDVEQATLGWAAGLRLAQLDAAPRDPPLPASQEPDDVVAEYVSEELIESSSVALRSFLDVTCWLPMVTEPVYAAITGGAVDRIPVARAELAALPIMAVASCPGAFRYPPILSRVLQQRFSHRVPGEATGARRRAAEACRRAGDLMTALRLFLDAGCVDEAADVCAAVVAENEAALRAVDALLRERPDFTLDSERWLPWRVRAAVAVGRIDEARRLLEHVDSAGRSDLAPGQAVRSDLLTARAAVADHIGDVTALLACADRVLAPIERSTVDGSEVERARAWRVRAQVWSGDTAGARETLRALDAAGGPAPAGTTVELALARAWLEWVHGDASRVAELMTAARERDADGAGGDHVRAAELVLLEGAAHREHNRLAKAGPLLRQAHTIARTASHHVVEAFAASELARCHRAAGTAMEALELVVSTRARYPDLPCVVDAQLRDVEVVVRLDHGDVAGAQAVVNGAPAGVDRQLLAGRVALQQAPAQARELLDAIEACTPRQAVRKLLLHAQLPGIDRQAASTSLVRAVAIGGSLGLVRTFLDEGPAVSRRLPEVALDVDDHALGRLAALACQDLALSPIGGPTGLIEPLTRRELAVLRMLPVRMSNREMAGQMYISVNTLKTHIRSIYRKLGVAHRSEAVRRAKALQLV